jgi:hypothetical protein
LDGATRTPETVATGLGWSTSKLNRYERGDGLNPREVARLLVYYQVTGEARARLLGQAREASEKGWWEAYADVASAEYRDFIALEAEAVSVEVWHVDVVTGLLQTERYTRSLIAQFSRVEPIAPAIIERRVGLRMLRKHALEQESPLSLIVVPSESVLKRQFGYESVMKSRCTH